MHFRFALAAATLVLLFGAFVCTAEAQFTVTIPSFPKIKKNPKPTPKPTNNDDDSSSSSSSSSTSSRSSSSDDEDKPKNKTCQDDVFYQVHNENIEKTIQQAKDYTPGSRDYYVQDFNDDENIYLKAALSEKKRASWESEWKDEFMKKCINDRLDELAAAADKTIGSYKPVGYTLGTPAEKAILKSGVTDLAQASAVYNVGLKSANWTIVKDDYNLPLRRKRFGTIWAKYPWNKYCTLIYVNLVQDYAGGGTYNAPGEAQFVSWEFAGCPAK